MVRPSMANKTTRRLASDGLMENTGPGSRGTGHGVRGPGVWKTRGVENAGCGKHRVRVENTGSGGKHGV